jgi:hypothetical protein
LPERVVQFESSQPSRSSFFETVRTTITVTKSVVQRTIEQRWGRTAL